MSLMAIPEPESEGTPCKASRREVREKNRRIGRQEARRRAGEAVRDMLRLQAAGYSSETIAVRTGFSSSEVRRILDIDNERGRG